MNASPEDTRPISEQALMTAAVTPARELQIIERLKGLQAERVEHCRLNAALRRVAGASNDVAVISLAYLRWGLRQAWRTR